MSEPTSTSSYPVGAAVKVSPDSTLPLITAPVIVGASLIDVLITVVELSTVSPVPSLTVIVKVVVSVLSTATRLAVGVNVIAWSAY